MSEIQEYKEQSEQGTALASTVVEGNARQIEEVRGQMLMARQFPRVEANSYTKIMNSCKRKSFAESAIYSYPRGGQKVTGPSIRMAEDLARNWGNIDFGVVEIEQRFGESTVMAYAWDLETNVRQKKVFQVKHERFTRNGAYKLTDPRDIYEIVANQGSRRLRNCILGVIPGDIVEAAVGQCRETMASKEDSMPLPDRIRAMVASFAELGVTSEQLERFVDATLDTMTPQHVFDLKDVFRSVAKGDTKVADWFKADKPSEKAETLDEIVDEGEKKSKAKAKGKK